jgi:hypothetical protein
MGGSATSVSRRQPPCFAAGHQPTIRSPTNLPILEWQRKVDTLRQMQMISEVGAEQNTTTVVMMPSEFVSVAKSVADYLGNFPRWRRADRCRLAGADSFSRDECSGRIVIVSHMHP